MVEFIKSVNEFNALVQPGDDEQVKFVYFYIQGLTQVMPSYKAIIQASRHHDMEDITILAVDLSDPTLRDLQVQYNVVKVPQIVVIGHYRPAASGARAFEDDDPRKFNGLEAGPVRRRYAVTTEKSVFDCLFEVTRIQIKE